MIDKSIWFEIQQQLHSNEDFFPFISEFKVLEHYDLRWEASSYVISMPQSGLPESNVLLLLLERLEYVEQQWSWNASHVQDIRMRVLNLILDHLLQKVTFEPISHADLVTRIVETQLEALFSIHELTKTSQHMLLHNEWNLFQVFIRNNHEDYLLMWYTTA